MVTRYEFHALAVGRCRDELGRLLVSALCSLDRCGGESGLRHVCLVVLAVGSRLVGMRRHGVGMGREGTDYLGGWVRLAGYDGGRHRWGCAFGWVRGYSPLPCNVPGRAASAAWRGLNHHLLAISVNVCPEPPHRKATPVHVCNLFKSLNLTSLAHPLGHVAARVVSREGGALFIAELD